MSAERERYVRLHRILGEARGLSGARLDACLAESCGADVALREQVLELLAAGSDEEADDPFAESQLAGAQRRLAELVDSDASAWLPETIGGYEIVRRIGHGGMGVVYEAEQRAPQRRVAIKLLHPMHATVERLRRFRQEAELLGRLQHPGIAQIIEAGTYDLGRGPQPFIAMELVQGLDLRTHCEQHGLTREARVELLARVADAVEYAHAHGIIHRDLKPDNVLVNPHGQPRVLDFGIARADGTSATLSTVLTEDGKLVGTLAYMAPEQLRRSEGAVTRSVDVYALGVLGFELLLGRLPHAIEALPVTEAIALLASSEAPRASRFDSSLRGDLETILGKALETERERRYASAAAFAQDLRSYLENRPIEARPPSRLYLARKFTRRHRGLVIGAVATLLVALIGAGIALRFALDATARADELARSSYVLGLTAAQVAIERQDYSAALARLDALPADQRGWECEYLRARCAQHIEVWELPAPVVVEPVFDSEGRRMFALMQGGRLGTWDVQTGALLGERELPGLAPRISQHGASAALHGASGRLAACGEAGAPVIADLATGEVLEPGRGHVPGEVVRLLAWDEPGRRLLLEREHSMLWQAGEERVLTSGGKGPGALDPSGTRAAFASGDLVELIDLATGELLAEQRLKDVVIDVAFAPDGETLALSGQYQNVHLLDGRTLEPRRLLTGHMASVLSVAWSPDGTRLVSCSNDASARVWELEAGGGASVFDTGESGDCYATFTPDGQDVLIAGQRMLRFTLGMQPVLRGQEGYVYALAFSPDGGLMATACMDGRSILVWDVHRAQLRWKLPAPQGGLAWGYGRAAAIGFSADGRRLVAGMVQTYCWDMETGQELPVPQNDQPVERFVEALGDGVEPWAFDPRMGLGGRYVVVCHGGQGATLYELDSAEDGIGARLPNRLSMDGLPKLKDVARSVRPLVGHVGQVWCADVSPDGRRVATGGVDATVRLWDTRTGEPLLVLRGHGQYVKDVQFSPDGTLLASASGDTTVRLWDTLPPHQRRALSER